MVSPKVAYLAELRRNFAESRADFYARHGDRGLVEDVISAAREHKVPDRKMLLRFLEISNSRTVEVVQAFLSTFGISLDHPHSKDYKIAVNECVDARNVVFTLVDLLGRPWLHQRTAAAIAKDGSLFRAVDPFFGKTFIVTHYGCGGENLAHGVHSGAIHTTDPHVLSIAAHIHPRVARIADPVMRSVANSRSQAVAARGVLEAEGLPTLVYPSMFTWQNWPSDGSQVDVNKAIDFRWCGTGPEDALVAQMRDNGRLLWGIANEHGINPLSQFSFVIVYYDPYRLGRVNGPRPIFDGLPNTLFCVTEDFRRVHEGITSDSAVGSLRYAGFLNGGAVSGVGGQNGSRIVIVLDPDPKVAEAAKRNLLMSSQEIRDYTHGGETIVLAHYNVDTAQVTFL